MKTPGGIWFPCFDPTYRPRFFLRWVLWRAKLPSGLRFFGIGRTRELIERWVGDDGSSEETARTRLLAAVMRVVRLHNGHWSCLSDEEARALDWLKQVAAEWGIR